MSISKPENAAQSTERDDEFEREQAGRDGGFENGYGYGYDGEREPESESGSESEMAPHSAASSEEESALHSPSQSETGLEDEDAAAHQTTTGAVNRDLTAHEGEREELEAGEPESEFETAQEPRATTLSTAEPGATIGHDGADRDEETTGRDEELNEDSMSGEAVQTQPQSTSIQPSSAPGTASAMPSAQSPLATDPGPVLAPETSLDFRERWHGIQAEFIDDPRRAVEDADRLVADVARAFTTSVEERRQGLTSGWQNNEHGETEELRLTMRQYRALVDHILHD